MMMTRAAISLLHPGGNGRAVRRVRVRERTNRQLRDQQQGQEDLCKVALFHQTTDYPRSGAHDNGFANCTKRTEEFAAE